MMDAVRRPETLVAIPESQLRMYERMHAAVRENTRRTLERCEENRERRENPWWRQLHEAICGLPHMAQAVIGIVCGMMFAMTAFTVLLEVLYG